ncbi:putative cyclic nucleotide-binding domain, Ion transport domain, rmlC-like jelly roll [Helianthus annuus]|nr:putative cyclic nucleotide-binding domain, Ion transport domain, rmlC-like jelly roll [Helianthus annuus]
MLSVWVLFYLPSKTKPLLQFIIMDFKQKKQTRFRIGENRKSKSDRPLHIPGNERPEDKISVPSDNVGKGRTIPSSSHVGIKLGESRSDLDENNGSKGKRILDPGSEVILKWNRIFLVSCVVSLFVDPLFFYVPYVEAMGSSQCMMPDLVVGVLVTCLRTIADIFYTLHIVLKFRTAYISPCSRLLGRGELVTDQKKIARRYLKSSFFIDLVATLPLPQIVLWFTLPVIRSPDEDCTTNALVLIVLLQYIPRLYLIFPLSSQIIKTTGVVTKTVWAGVAYNLAFYILASHVSFVGSLWYLLSIERLATCWTSTCIREDNAKCSYCLCWGLQNLSSYGQTLSTTAFIGETLFAILIAVVGLVLFSHLIGNMQTYLKSITARLEEWRLRRRDTESWMRHRQLPCDLQERVRKFVQYKWLATRGVDEESIICSLPKDLRRDIQCHLCLDLVRRVPFFSEMDGQLLDAICARLVSSLSTQGTYIVREGDPVSEMLFIIRGRLDSSTTNGGRTGFYNSITLRPGDFCGEELLEWALLPKSTLNLPSSTRTVKALTEVEAFALSAEDLKLVAKQFRRLHSKKLQHTFRFYSYHWRTWAAFFIQAAWRRAKKRRMQWSRTISESSHHDHETEHHDNASSSSSNSLNVTMLASRFARNTRRGILKTKDVELIKLQKPEEPDFSADPEDD